LAAAGSGDGGPLEAATEPAQALANPTHGEVVMRAPARIPILAIASILLIGSCSGGPVSSPSTPAATPAPPSAAAGTPAPSATPAPTPSPTPDVADLVEGALATLRDPALAVEFTLSGQVIISGTTFDSEGTITVVGPDLAGTYELQPFDIRSSEVSAGGKVWLRSGDGRWTRDDQLPAAVPTLASAFQGTPGVEHWEEMTVESTRLIRAELNGVNLDGLLVALGMADPGTTGARGTVALMVTPAGALAAIQFDNVIHSPGEGIEPEEMTRTLTVERLATAGEAGAPIVRAPDDYWLRYYSEDLGYLITFPRTMKRGAKDGADTYTDTGGYLTAWAAVLDTGQTLSTLAKAEIARLKKGGLKVVKDTTLTLDEVPARRIEMTFTEGGKAHWGVKVITVHGDVQYQLVWLSLAREKKADLPILDEMLQSFRSAF